MNKQDDASDTLANINVNRDAANGDPTPEDVTGGSGSTSCSFSVIPVSEPVQFAEKQTEYATTYTATVKCKVVN